MSAKRNNGERKERQKRGTVVSKGQKDREHHRIRVSRKPANRWEQGGSEKNCKGNRSYGTVWKDLEKQEYQHRNQNKHIKSDSDERGNVCERNMDAKEKDRNRLLSF